MILVDTSVWIDFFKGKSTPQVNFLESAITHSQEIFISGIIYTEILQGIKAPKQYAQVLKALDNFCYIQTTKSTHILAADIYRKLRNKGITIRKTIDCVIGATAIESKLLLLHNDKDFVPIEKHFNLKVLFH